MAALGWDAGRVYHAHVLPGEETFNEGPVETETQFYEFILEFRLGTVFVYRYLHSFARLILVTSCRPT
jgi:hypothetical protein